MAVPFRRTSKTKKRMRRTHLKKEVGALTKCPNCGEIINAFESVCSSCGFELRDSEVSSATKMFKLELQKVESERAKYINSDIHNSEISPIDRKIANMITAFPVPNNKEDIFEFLFLAVSNIDPVSYDTTTNGYGVGAERKGKLLVSNAWESKYLQVYQKAKMMFPADKTINDVSRIYHSKKQEINKTKLDQTNMQMAIIAAVITPLVLLMATLIIIFG